MNNDYQLIKRFFKFDLSENELQQIEQRLQYDGQFRDKMRFYEYADTKFRTEFDGQEITEKQQLQQEWAKWKAITPNTPIYRRLLTPKILSIAASLVLLLAASLWWFGQKQMDKNELVAQYWQQTEQVAQSNTRTGATDDAHLQIFATAQRLYQKQQYGQALVQLEKIGEGTLRDRILLLQGQCYFQLNEVNSAAQKFLQVIALEQVGLKDKAHWFLALTYLKGDNYGLAKQHLDVIIEQDYPLAKEAKALLKQL